MSKTLLEPPATELSFASGAGVLPAASNTAQSPGPVRAQPSSVAQFRSRHRRQTSVTLTTGDLSKFGQDEGYGSSSLPCMDSDLTTESDASPTLSDESVFLLPPLLEMPDNVQDTVPVRSKRKLRFDDQVLVFRMCSETYPDENAAVYEVPATEFDRRARRRVRQGMHLCRVPSSSCARRAETNFLHLLAVIAAFLVVGLGMMLAARNAGRVS